MRYRRFGKTELNLSTFSLGAKRLFCPSSQSEEEQQTRRKAGLDTIHKALELGINHIETDFCSPASEALVGEALSGRDRSSYYLTSKFEACVSTAEMRTRLEQTLARLRTDYLDCFCIKGLNTADCLNRVTSPNGFMEAVEEARTQGRIRHVGFSTRGPLDFVLKALNSDLFEFVQIHYSYFNTYGQHVLNHAKELDLGVAVLSPTLAGGHWHKPSSVLIEACDPFPPASINDRFILQHPAVTTLRIGALSPKDFEMHADALDNDGALSDAETLALAKLDVRRVHLRDSWCTDCHDCLPCPESIAIPEILRLRNMALAYGMTTHVRARYGFSDPRSEQAFDSSPGTQCNECGDCIPRCPQKLDIPRLLAEADTLLRSNGRKPRTLATRAKVANAAKG